MSKIHITVPLTPPSGNHYKGLRVIGGRVSTYVRSPAKAFWQAVAICASGQAIRADAYEVTFCVYLGKGIRLDVDNGAKVVLDSLTKAGVIDSDAKITDLHISKRRDWDNPRTEIAIEAVSA